MNERRPIVAVIGRGGGNTPEELACATELGRSVIEHGYRLVTGGKAGVMEAASRGARQAASWSEGDVLGILPGADRAEANDYCDIVIPTGLGLARNGLVVATADVVVAIGGGSGTLSELALAWQIGRPIIALGGDALKMGWADRVAGEAIDDRRDDVVHAAGSVVDALALVESLLDARG